MKRALAWALAIAGGTSFIPSQPQEGDPIPESQEADLRGALGWRHAGKGSAVNGGFRKYGDSVTGFILGFLERKLNGMQNRHVADIGDYVKLAILRRLACGRRLGVAWWLFPDEHHNANGGHRVVLKSLMRFERARRSWPLSLFSAARSITAHPIGSFVRST